MTPEIHSLIQDGVILVLAIAVSNLYRVHWLKQPHDKPLPTQALLPRPNLSVEEELEDELRSLHTQRPRDEARIDTLAELAKALRQEMIQ